MKIGVSPDQSSPVHPARQKAQRLEAENEPHLYYCSLFLCQELGLDRKPDRITFLKKGMRLPWGGGVVTLLTLVLAEPPCSPSSASSSSNSRGSSSKAKLVISLPGPVRKEVKGEEEGDEHGDTA